MIVAAALMLAVGLALGLLGGGGSVLTVPVLVSIAGLPAKEAIATSLVVVGATALAALVPHAITGRVAWRTGAIFGAAGMAGAYAGGWVARFVPGWLLLGAFALLMVVSAVAMLRSKQAAESDRAADGPAPSRRALRIVAEGLGVGAITGLVGAGGGFLVVPALVLFGKLPMKRAVATSLLVIAMKSFAGFAGYATHVSIDPVLVLAVSGAAIAGALAGSVLMSRVPQEVLRRAFAWLVLAAAAALVVAQIPVEVRQSAVFHSVFVERWPWWAGGLGVAAVAAALLLADGKLLGVTTGLSETCALPRGDLAARKSWRPGFLLGIAAGAALAGSLAGWTPRTVLAGLVPFAGEGVIAQAGILAASGVLIGWGARRAGGCTSGHGIVGTAQLAPASWIATAGFMAAGFGTTWLLAATVG